MAASLDTLRFSQRLQQSGVSREQADAHAELARDMVMAELVTKDDLAVALRELQLQLIVKVGAMIAAAVGIIVAAQRIF